MKPSTSTNTHLLVPQNRLHSAPSSAAFLHLVLSREQRTCITPPDAGTGNQRVIQRACGDVGALQDVPLLELCFSWCFRKRSGRAVSMLYFCLVRRGSEEPGRFVLLDISTCRSSPSLQIASSHVSNTSYKPITDTVNSHPHIPSHGPRSMSQYPVSHIPLPPPRQGSTDTRPKRKAETETRQETDAPN